MVKTGILPLDVFVFVISTERKRVEKSQSRQRFVYKRFLRAFPLVTWSK